MRGNPTQAATAFARNCGGSVDELERLVTTRGLAGISRHERAAIRTCSGIIHAAIAALPIARRMRWGAHPRSSCARARRRSFIWREVVEIEVLG